VEYRLKDKLILVEDIALIREPNKNPTIIERARYKEDFYPDL